MDITLRPYQQECVDLIDSKESGRYLISLATGLGKTVIFSHLKRKGRTLILSHRDELVRQPEKYFTDECSFGIEKAEEMSNGEDVVSASVQSMCRPNRLARFSPDDFDTIILDEAHHASAANTSYMSILKYFTGARKLVGFTATPRRGDGVRLTDVFDEILYSRDIKWGIENGYLCRVRAARVIANYTLNDIQKIAGDYALGEIEKKLDPYVLTTTAKVYADQCKPMDRHVLVYCPTKRICVELATIMRSILPAEDASTIQVLLGDTDPDERRNILDGFRSGTVKVIINCMVLTEGTDLPVCDAIINLRPTANASLYQQIIGRGTRLYPGKEYMTIFDILPEDVNSRRSICSAPTLFGIEPENIKSKHRDRINESEDLLDVCNELNLECADVVKRIDLHVEMMDAFIDDAQTLLTEAYHSSLASAHHYLTERNATKDASIDFGSKVVLLNPTAEKRYEIHPSFKSKVTVSEPDILGNVTVEGYFPDIAHLHYRMKLTMPEQEAVEFVDLVCRTAPEQSRYAWSISDRERWNNEAATDNQIYRIGREIDSLFSLYMSETSQYKKLGANLSKLQASDYLDYINQVKYARDEKKAFSHRPNARQSTIDGLVKKYEGEFEAPYLDNEEKQKVVRVMREMIAKAEEAIRKEKEQAMALASSVGPSKVTLSVVAKYCNKRDASAAQQSYANSLYTKCEARNIHFDNNVPVYGTSTHCSLLISLFRWCSELPDGLSEVIISSNSFREAEQTVTNIIAEDTHPAVIDVTLEVSYTG